MRLLPVDPSCAAARRRRERKQNDRWFARRRPAKMGRLLDQTGTSPVRFTTGAWWCKRHRCRPPCLTSICARSQRADARLASSASAVGDRRGQAVTRRPDLLESSRAFCGTVSAINSSSRREKPGARSAAESVCCAGRSAPGRARLFAISVASLSSRSPSRGADHLEAGCRGA